MDISQTTRDLCDMLKKNIILLLRAYKDPAVDISALRIFPNQVVREVESEEEEDDIFNWLCIR